MDNIGRRKWDIDQFKADAERKEKELEEEKAGEARKRREVVIRANLKARDYKLDFSSTIGKTTLVSATSSLAQRGGYYCDVCDVLLKDSKTYVDHINGRKHQQKLNMSMNVERSTLAQVRARLSMLRAQRLTAEGRKVADLVNERVVKHRKLVEAEFAKISKKHKQLLTEVHSIIGVGGAAGGGSSDVSDAEEEEGAGSGAGAEAVDEEDMVFYDDDDVVGEVGANDGNDDDDAIYDQERKRRRGDGNSHDAADDASAGEIADEAEDDDDGEFEKVVFTEEQIQAHLAQARARGTAVAHTRALEHEQQRQLQQQQQQQQLQEGKPG